MALRLPRVAFVTTVYDHTDVGGGTFVHYLRQAVEQGHLDLVFFSDYMEKARTPFERRVDIPAAVKQLPGGFLTRAWYYHQAVQEENKKQPFDIVWHNNALTSIFDIVKGIDLPVVGMINDYNNIESRTPFATREKFGGFRALIRFGWHQFERYVARRADYLVVNSKYMADLIRRMYGIESARIKLLYKGVDLSEFTYVQKCSPQSPVRILFVKSDFVTGGLYDLLEALEKFPVSVELTIVGPPEAAHPLIRQAALKSGISDIHLMGRVSRDEVPEYYQSHDIFCVPSRSEALGVSFMEALASGTPTVGSKVGGIPEVLDGGRAGWLVEPQNPGSIRETLMEVIQNGAQRVAKTQHGRKHVECFSQTNMVSEMLKMALSVSQK